MFISDAIENLNPNGLASIFSPRMDFEQWKPLTGRGDPLRNDPTYDYEPPVLDRVRYWADDTKNEQHPEKKNEVLMLGISSRKPSITSRPPPPPPLPPRRQQPRPTPPKYEDFTYKLSDHYPMTILVPPPPPPPGHQPQLFVLTDDKHHLSSNIKLTNPPKLLIQNTTQLPVTLTSEYALQEANLIYQSSTTNQHWIVGPHNTTHIVNNAVSSDYAGWGPTTPIENIVSENYTHNLISNEHTKLVNQPYSFYKPMLSVNLPPETMDSNPQLLSTFLPTVLPPRRAVEQSSITFTPVTQPVESSTYETTTDKTENQEYYEETTTEKQTTLFFHPTTISYEQNVKPSPEVSIFDMLAPMMTMPLVNGPERLEDNLYAHASEHKQIIHKHRVEDMKIETMQTLQPPPPHSKFTDKPIAPKDHHVFTHDPYLNMRYTTTSPVTASIRNSQDHKSTSEVSAVPMYLIIQGHSKVKTYSSKQKPTDNDHTINNEIPKPNETNEVKHLHPIKDKSIMKPSETNRTSRFQNLKSLVDNGLGSIEIQEADIGIKYDVSDGSEVPLEVYRKGLVDGGENKNYSSKELRPKNK